MNLLAQNDAIFQALLKVVSNGHARHLFDPESELLFFLQVIFLCNLNGKMGQKQMHVRQKTDLYNYYYYNYYYTKV